MRESLVTQFTLSEGIFYPGKQKDFQLFRVKVLANPIQNPTMCYRKRKVELITGLYNLSSTKLLYFRHNLVKVSYYLKHHI